MFMLSFNFVIGCDLFEWKQINGRSSFQEGRVEDTIIWFNLTTFVCLSQARTWISNIICSGLFCVIEFSLNER